MTVEYDTKIVVPKDAPTLWADANAAYPFIEFETRASFWTRLWNLLSNPFRYLFTGRVRL